MLIARTVEQNTSGDKDLSVSTHEAHQFARDRLAGKERRALLAVALDGTVLDGSNSSEWPHDVIIVSGLNG